MSKKYINTLDFYGFRENNKMEPVIGKGYKVKVSDKDGNIITIEKDDSLYACVKLAFDSKTGVLSLLDAAHEDSVLAEIEMPNADYIYNCRFDEELNSILFDVKSLYGDETSTIELDVESLVELYEAGQGIEIGDKNPDTGRKPISIKLAEGEELLQLTDNGLGLDKKVITEDELDAAISGKADTEYVDELFSEISGLTSGITEILDVVEEHDKEIEKLKKIVGTDEEVPSLFEQIEDNREDIAELDEEIGEISGTVDAISEKIDDVSNKLESISGNVDILRDAIEEEVLRAKEAENDLQADIDAEVGRALSAETEISEKIVAEESARKNGSVAEVDYVPSAKAINFLNANNEIIDSIDTTDFVKDGMIDSVELETVSGTTYIVITWNTDSGKEVTRLDIGDLFEADDYYKKDEIDAKVQELKETDAALIVTNGEQWAAINQNRTDLEAVDTQLWNAINNEITNRQNADSNLFSALADETNARTTADNGLQSQINVEKEQRTSEDARLNNLITAETQARIDEYNNLESSVNSKIGAEKNRALAAEAEIAANIAAEVQRATREEARIENKYDEDIAELNQADRVLKQYVIDQDADIHRRIDGVVRDLNEYADLSITRDRALSGEIRDIKDTYATIEYVDTQDEHFKESAIRTSTGFAKSYTDNEIDELEISLKQYCDTEHAELQEAISNNTTKINVISNLRGVVGSDISNYDDSGNGILDVLHREFHAFEQSYGTIKDIRVEDGNLIITYYTETGEKETSIPIEQFIDLSDYYTKEEVNNIVSEAVEDVNSKIDGKLDTSAFTEAINDLDERVSTNTNNIANNTDLINNLIEKLGYNNNETLVTTNEHEVAFGEYNISNSGDEPSGQTIFSVGVGTSDENRANAIDIRKDGTVYMLVEGEMVNVNILLGMLSHEVY